MNVAASIAAGRTFVMKNRMANWKWFVALVGMGLWIVAVPAQQPGTIKERNAVASRGLELFQQKKYREAAIEIERAVELSIRVFGADDTRTTSTEGMLAHTYHRLGEYAKAEPLFVRALAGTEKLYGKVSPQFATALAMLGFNASKRGDDPVSEGYLERSIKTWAVVPKSARAGYDPSNSSYATALLNLGQIFRRRGDFPKAEVALSRSRRLWEAGTGKDDDNALETMLTLGYVCAALGDYPKAEALLKEVAQAWKVKKGESPELAKVLQELGYTYMNMGQMAQAETVFKQCLKIRETKLGLDHLDTATILQVMGGLYRRQKKYEAAEAYYRRGLAIMEAKHGSDSPELFFIVESMAVLEYARQQYAQSLATSQRSLKMSEAKFGSGHPNTALVLNNIGDDYWNLGERAKAESFYSKALKLREARLGPDNPNTMEVLNRLAILYASTGRWEEAMASYDRVRRANRRYIASVLPGLTEAQQLTFLQAHALATFGYYQALSVGMARPNDPIAVSRSAEWLLNGKAITQQALAERGMQARASTDPAQAKLLEQLNAVRSKLAGLTLSGPEPGKESAHLKELDRLTAEEQDLAKRLGQAMGRPARDDPWVELAEVRRTIPAESVLIEIVEFWVTDFKSISGPVLREKEAKAHFVAWIIPAPGKGEIKIVDLGLSKPIEEAVAAVGKGFKDSPKRIRAKGEPDANEELHLPMQTLSRLILEPLLPHIGDTKRLILCPDTDLWLVPWAALPLKDGRLAIEQFEISHVVSGRDLTVPNATVKSTRPLVLADPDYNLRRRKTQQTAKAASKNPRDDGAIRALAGGSRLNAKRLEASATEASEVAPRLEEWLGVKPRVLTDAKALESVVKTARNPRVLMLCTHGFFLADQGHQPEDAEASSPARRVNPLLRCGLLLAGCNHPPKAGEVGDDGVLTGLEIVGCDLRGTELVVLSACETGVGEIQNRLGEGVAGLRQAFQLAGAEAVVATLWQVPDRQSARLMTLFFDGLAAKKDKPTALAEAQRTIIKERRAKQGAAHPFFWAAYTLTGR